MRTVIQRVSSASVSINGEEIAVIGRGLVILLGVQSGDTAPEVEWLARKIAQLRIFDDEAGRMNLSLAELGSDAAPRALVVSQFTLLASTRKGQRPSFNDAARPAEALPFYELFLQFFRAGLPSTVVTGRFGAAMAVRLVNDGPVTLVIDSRLRE